MEKKKVICWICGKIIEEHDFYIHDFYDRYGNQIEYETPWGRRYCQECHDKITKQTQDEFNEYIRLKKKMMFYKACDALEKQNVKMYDYHDAIKVVENHMDAKPDKYDSSYEVIAAIVLVKNRILSKMQYKIGKYQVDFLLPEIGIVLEIDGERHKYSKKKDSIRDEFIKKELGYGWDIVRIKTDYLDMKAEKLVEAINAVVDYRETNRIPWRKLSL